MYYLFKKNNVFKFIKKNYKICKNNSCGRVSNLLITNKIKYLFISNKTYKQTHHGRVGDHVCVWKSGVGSGGIPSADTTSCVMNASLVYVVSYRHPCECVVESRLLCSCLLYIIFIIYLISLVFFDFISFKWDVKRCLLGSCLLLNDGYILLNSFYCFP